MVCKIGFPNWNLLIAILRASMVVTYDIKLFRTGADRQRYFNVSTPSSRRDKKSTHTYSHFRDIADLSFWSTLDIPNHVRPYLPDIYEST